MTKEEVKKDNEQVKFENLRIKFYAIYDKSAVAFGLPFPAPTHGAALRHFEEMLSKNEHMSKFAQDYSLYFIAAGYDERVGAIVPGEVRLCLGEARDYVSKGVPDVKAK